MEHYKMTVQDLWNWLSDETVQQYYNVGVMMCDMGRRVNGFDIAFYGERGCTLDVQCEGRRVVGILYECIGAARLDRKTGEYVWPQGFVLHAADRTAIAWPSQPIEVTTLV